MHRKWMSRLRELGLDPKGYFFCSNANGLIDDFEHGRKVFVMIDARPDLGIGSTMCFISSKRSVREALHIMAVV
jgi:hypothetical protein